MLTDVYMNDVGYFFYSEHSKFQAFFEGSYKEKAAAVGDFRICLDNSYSSFSKKHVFVDFAVREEIVEGNYSYEDSGKAFRHPNIRF
jgi:hypothetical protein